MQLSFTLWDSSGASGYYWYYKPMFGLKVEANLNPTSWFSFAVLFLMVESISWTPRQEIIFYSALLLVESIFWTPRHEFISYSGSLFDIRTLGILMCLQMLHWNCFFFCIGHKKAVIPLLKSLQLQNSLRFVQAFAWSSKYLAKWSPFGLQIVLSLFVWLEIAFLVFPLEWPVSCLPRSSILPGQI